MAQFDLDTARAKRDVGMALAATGNDEFLAIMRAYAIHYSQWQGQVTADDVRAYADRSGLQPTSPHVWGSVFQGKGWRRIGYHQSASVANHGHYYPVWQWVGD